MPVIIVRMDLILKNPFDAYDGKLSVKDAIFLTKTELNPIEEKPIFNDRLQKVRDFFVLLVHWLRSC